MRTTLAFRALPSAVVILGAAAGALQWLVVAHDHANTAADESVVAASDAVTRILSYRADTVEKDLAAARSALTGPFLDSYSELVDTEVIPGARQRRVSADATVTAAASVSATADHAVALVFVDQTITVGDQAPTASPSAVRVQLDRIGGRWLVSGFDPI
jgi:Mce-associated membrane protein